MTFKLEPPKSIISVDLGHAAVLLGIVASVKPDLVLELGYGGGYTSDAIQQALTWNTKGRLVIVDNWCDWGGQAPAMVADLKDASIIVSDEEEYVKACESEKFDILISDADHHRSHLWVADHFRIVRPGGILFFHDVCNKSFSNLWSIVEYVRSCGLQHFLFDVNSRQDENCHRGWLMVINRKLA